MTNRDKINKMTNEELAQKILGNTNYHCVYCEYHNTPVCSKGADCIEGIKDWLDEEAELTADEMFEELRYKKESRVCCLGAVSYISSSHRIALFIENDDTGEYKSYRYEKINIESKCDRSISEAEARAIHKKIEELKNETTNN